MRSEELKAPLAPLLVLHRLNLVGSRQSAVGSNVAFGDVIGYWLLVIGGICGAVTSRKSQVASLESLVIGHRSLGAGIEPCIAGLKSRLLLNVSQSDVRKSKVQNPKSIIKSVAKQRKPKFSILNSQFSIKNLSTTHYPLPTHLSGGPA